MNDKLINTTLAAKHYLAKEFSEISYYMTLSYQRLHQIMDDNTFTQLVAEGFLVKVNGDDEWYAFKTALPETN